MKTVNKIMASPFGSFLKGLMAIILTQYLIELQQGHELFSMDKVMLKKLLTAALVANLPVIINWLNPAYKNYGKKGLKL